MKSIMSLDRRCAIKDLSNKRTQAICKLMDNHHVDGLEEILRLVDRPVGTPEEIRNATDYRHINAISEWYDLIANACRWLQNIGLTMTCHVPVYWYDEETQSVVWAYADELVLRLDGQDVEYKGQQLINAFADGILDGVSTADITPEIAQRYAEMLDKALAEEPDLIAHLWNHL